LETRLAGQAERGSRNVGRGVRALGVAGGFSLLELMIVVAIIGILAGIAIPQYQDYLVRSKLVQAVSSLSDMRVRMEQFFQDNRTYVGACAAGTLAPLPANTANFTFSCTNACGGAAGNSLTATAYVVRACGIGSMTGFELTIDQANVRRTIATGSGWTLPATNCWVTNRGGGC
jgi:type IV pilus assembly protein PilE